MVPVRRGGPVWASQEFNMRMRGSRILVECLKKEKVEVIFHYTGGSVISVFDELYRYGTGITCMQPCHEQAGTQAADAYARSTGKVGVVLVTSGPVATNTVTGIATAYKDSIPMVVIVITGQVPMGDRRCFGQHYRRIMAGSDGCAGI